MSGKGTGGVNGSDGIKLTKNRIRKMFQKRWVVWEKEEGVKKRVADKSKWDSLVSLFYRWAIRGVKCFL